MNLSRLSNLFKRTPEVPEHDSKALLDEQNGAVDKIYKALSTLLMDIAITKELTVYDVHSYTLARLITKQLPYALSQRYVEQFPQLYPHLKHTKIDVIDYVNTLITDVHIRDELDAGIRLCILRNIESSSNVNSVVEGLVLQLLQGNLHRRQRPCSVN